MYHSIYEKREDYVDIFSLSLNKFRLHIRTIAKYFKVVSSENATFKQENEVVITFDDGFKDNMTLALPILEEHQLPFSVFVATGLLDTKGYLSTDELREFSKHPLVTIGVHGHLHEPLGKMSLEDAKADLMTSKNKLEEIIGKKVTTMSFPHGSYNQELVTFLKENGFTFISTSDFGQNIEPSDKYNRLTIFDCETIYTLNQKISGKWNWM